MVDHGEGDARAGGATPLAAARLPLVALLEALDGHTRTLAVEEGRGGGRAAVEEDGGRGRRRRRQRRREG